MKNISFSIVIPTYNRAGILEDSLKSVLLQSYSDYEVIVVDDGSTDDTVDRLKGIDDSRLRYLHIDNSERGAARNRGAEIAVGDYITFLDSDDYVFPEFLNTVARGLLLNSYPPFYHQAYEVVDQAGRKLNYNQKFPNGIAFLAKGNALSCIGVFIRKDVAAEFKFVEDRRLAGSEDWELWMRIAAHHGLKRGDQISARLVVHDSRSVFSFSEQQLLLRKRLFLEYVFQDEKVKEVFGGLKTVMSAYSDSYISLHLILAGHYKAGFKYFFKSIVKYPPCLFDRRTLGIIKQLTFGILKSKR